MVRRSDIYAQEILNKVFRKSLTLHGGSEWQVPMQETEFRQNSCFMQMKMALEWLAEGSVNVEGLYEIISPENPQSTYQDALNKRNEKLCVLFRWS